MPGITAVHWLDSTKKVCAVSKAQVLRLSGKLASLTLHFSFL